MPARYQALSSGTGDTSKTEKLFLYETFIVMGKVR